MIVQNPHHNVDVEEELVEEEKITSRTKKERTMKDFKQYIEGNLGKSLKDCSKRRSLLSIITIYKRKKRSLTTK